MLIIIILSDDYDNIKNHLSNYLKTGDTKTPNRGRGHRVSKRNLRYESGNDDDEEADLSPIKRGPSKKAKYSKSSDIAMISMVKQKYDLETDNECSDDEDMIDDEEELVSKLKKENEILRRKNNCLEGDVRDLKSEVRDMRQIVANVKELTNVNQALTDLTKTVVVLKSMRGGPPYSSPSLSRTSSPSPQPSPHTVDDFDEKCRDADVDSNMVSIHPGISILKAQKKILDACGGDPKKFTHTIMEMMWSREVLGSHSMTGRSSNAHKDKEPKPCLDATKISALCALVVKKFKTDEQKVKNLIKTKLHNVQKCLKLKKAVE